MAPVYTALWFAFIGLVHATFSAARYWRSRR